MSKYLVEHATILGMMILYLAFCLGVGWYFKSKAAAGVKAFYVAKREIPAGLSHWYASTNS